MNCEKCGRLLREHPSAVIGYYPCACKRDERAKERARGKEEEPELQRPRAEPPEKRRKDVNGAAIVDAVDDENMGDDEQEDDKKRKQPHRRKSDRLEKANLLAILSLSAKQKRSDIVELVHKIRLEMAPSNQDWKGKAVVISRYENPVIDANKALVAIQGNAHGCHTCLTHIAADFTQPWIGDHIPPTELKKAVITKLEDTRWFKPHRDDGKRIVQVLFPQCDACAIKQSRLVKMLNDSPDKGGAIKNLDADEEKLLGGGTRISFYQNQTCILSSSARVSAAEGLIIQKLGQDAGCHSCGTMVPAHRWHADHCPPIAFHSPQVELAFRAFAISIPAFEARPQCPRCSHSQGGRMQDHMTLLRRLMAASGIKNYRGSANVDEDEEKRPDP